MPAGSRSLLAGTVEQNEDIAALITCNYITPTIPNRKYVTLWKNVQFLSTHGEVPGKFMAVFFIVASKRINSEVPRCCRL